MPCEAGYIGVGPEEGTFVAEVDAYAYAMERCHSGTLEEQEAFRQEIIPLIVEWYYSGNWIRAEED